MIKRRFLVVPLLGAMTLAAGCVSGETEPELENAEVDRGTIVLWAPGPMGQGAQWFDAGYVLLHTTYDSGGFGRAQFRLYTEDRGVWAEPFIESLCTDGNWVTAGKEGYIEPAYWMFLEADCPSPYSVSEAWVSVKLDY